MGHSTLGICEMKFYVTVYSSQYQSACSSLSVLSLFVFAHICSRWLTSSVDRGDQLHISTNAHAPVRIANDPRGILCDWTEASAKVWEAGHWRQANCYGITFDSLVPLSKAWKDETRKIQVSILIAIKFWFWLTVPFAGLSGFRHFSVADLQAKGGRYLQTGWGPSIITEVDYTASTFVYWPIQTETRFNFQRSTCLYSC